MTSGLISQGTIGYAPHGFKKEWSGVDGPTEAVSGKTRDKWNPYSVVIQEQRSTPSTTYPGYYFVSSTNPGFFSSYFTNAHEMRLQSKLISAVREHDFNLAVNVAQGKMTVDLVVDNLRKLGRSMLALKRGDFATAARQLGASQRPSRLKPGDISGRWLELQYGWLPALSDTFEACKAYEAITNGPRSQTVTVSIGVPYTFDGSQSPTNWTGLGTGRCSKKIIYEMSEPLAANRSLGLLDPLSVAWEIVPYSFVVDWFIPIGTYLENLSIIPSLAGRFCTTEFQRYHNRSIPRPDGPDPVSYLGCSQVYSTQRVNRVITSGLSTVGPSFVPFPSAMKPRRIWNAIALTAQIFLPGSTGNPPGRPRSRRR